ncbi:8484_t:CDS:2, partial [Racocetra persica]
IISQRTISRILKKAGLFTRIACAKPFISKKTKDEYHELAEAHLDWTTEDWKTFFVLLSISMEVLQVRPIVEYLVIMQFPSFKINIPIVTKYFNMMVPRSTG